MPGDGEPDYDERLSALEARARREDDLTAERDHWFGEAHRYKALYKTMSAASDNWYRKWKEATAEGVAMLRINEAAVTIERTDAEATLLAARLLAEAATPEGTDA